MKYLNGKVAMKRDTVLFETPGPDSIVMAGNVSDFMDRTSHLRVSGYPLPVLAADALLASDCYLAVAEPLKKARAEEEAKAKEEQKRKEAEEEAAKRAPKPQNGSGDDKTPSDKQNAS